MAGSRAAGDPLAVAAGVGHKALVPVLGVPMLARVLSTLRAARSIERIVVVGLDRALAQGDAGLRSAGVEELELVPGGHTPAVSAAMAIETLGLTPPVLITTADHPLLTPDTVDEFCDAATVRDVDVAFGIVPAEIVAATFPGVRRTRYRFRDGEFCGCNLYALLTTAGCGVTTVWTRVERYRKQPWRMVGELGVGVLLRFVLGRVALAEVTDLIHSRIGVQAHAVCLSQPAAGFDVDTIAQWRAAERYLQR
jgi:GTP:adenosylcobinamide-phosphate guanylyltransferase